MQKKLKMWYTGAAAILKEMKTLAFLNNLTTSFKCSPYSFSKKLNLCPCTVSYILIFNAYAYIYIYIQEINKIY